jgi:hypothetical protein
MTSDVEYFYTSSQVLFCWSIQGMVPYNNKSQGLNIKFWNNLCDCSMSFAITLVVVWILFIGYCLLAIVNEFWIENLLSYITLSLCHDPNLRLATKAKGLQGCGPRLSPGIAFSCLGSAKECECEGKKPHTPRWTPMLGVGVPVDSWMFREWL